MNGLLLALAILTMLSLLAPVPVFTNYPEKSDDRDQWSKIWAYFWVA